MFDMLFRMLPEWALPAVIGGIIWFGANFIFLSNLYFERAVLSEEPEMQQCLMEIYFRRNKFDYALYTASLTMIEPDAIYFMDKGLKNIEDEGYCENI